MVNKIKIKKSKSKINKKSLSPLISVILLIVISVILVSVVLSFGQGFTNQGLSDSDKVIKECNQITMFSGSKVDPKGNISFKNISPGNETHTIIGYKILSTSEDSNFNNFIYFEDENKTVTPGSTTIFQIPKFPPEEKFTIQLLTDKGEYISLDGIKNVPEELQDIPGPEPCSLTPTNGEIYYLEHLDYIDTNADTRSGAYTLARDLNFLDDASYCEPETYKTTWTTGTGWDPIGADITPFTGSFDGNNHTISNLYINRPTTDNVGFFGYTYGSITGTPATTFIKYFNLENINITGKNNTGGLVGFSSFTDINHIVISVIINGNDNVGGIIGYFKSDDYFGQTINYSSSSGYVNSTGTISGGLVGYNDNGLIEFNSSSCNVSGNLEVGGFMGKTNNRLAGTVRNNYSTGDVNGVNDVGGFMGNGYYIDVYNNYSTGDVNGVSDVGGFVGFAEFAGFSKNYSTGLVIGSTNIGGFMGRVGIFGSPSFGTSFWDMNTSGKTTSAGGTGKTTTQMKTQSTFTDWNFSTIWAIDEGTSYPYLQWQD